MTAREIKCCALPLKFRVVRSTMGRSLCRPLVTLVNCLVFAVLNMENNVLIKCLCLSGDIVSSTL